MPAGRHARRRARLTETREGADVLMGRLERSSALYVPSAIWSAIFRRQIMFHNISYANRPSPARI